MSLLNFNKKIKLKKNIKVPIKIINYTGYQIIELKNLRNYIEKSGCIG